MKIKLLFFDVDGTLTDGKLYIGANGEIMKAFDAKDGYGIKNILPNHLIVPIIITGRASAIVAYRAKELGITELYQNIQDKSDTLLAVLKKYHCEKQNAAYFGDDISDIPAMKECGIVGCPADAADEVKKISRYICSRTGGCGAAREFIEWIVHTESADTSSL